MPFVRISLNQANASDPRAIGDNVHRALVEALGIPADDHFQVISRHAADEIIYDPAFLGVQRSDGIVFIEITLAAGRTVEQKKALYARIAELLSSECGVRPGDIFVTLAETAMENFSFGDGRAQYADRVPPHLAKPKPTEPTPRDAISSDQLAPPVGPFSLGVRGPTGVLYLSGQVAQDPATGKLVEGDVAVQADQILRNVGTALAAAGKTFDDVIRVGVYLADMDDFGELNEVYARYFTAPHPARTAIGVAALPLGATVEMDVLVG
ncbi:Rid family detoxifying hydrolase [Flindersiella endophytica]